MKSPLDDMRNLAKNLELKRKEHQKTQHEEKLKVHRSLYGEALKNKSKIQESISAAAHVKVENFLGRIRFDYGIAIVCIFAIFASMWVCRDLVLEGREFFKPSKTEILLAESKETAEVNGELRKMLEGTTLPELFNSGKVSFGNVSGPRKDEMCGNLNLLSGQDFTVNTIVARRDPESYSAFCKFNEAGGYIIELARSDKGFSIIKIDSDN